MAGNRVVLIALLLLGLSVAACAGVEQAGLGRSILLVRQASAGAGGGPAAAGLQEAEGALDGCYHLTAAAMYLGAAVAAVAGAGLYLEGRAARRDGVP